MKATKGSPARHNEIYRPCGESVCDIILPVCDQFEFTKPCIESMLKNTTVPYRLIVINNGKNPQTKVYLKSLTERRGLNLTLVENKENVGWVRAINKGIELSKAPYLCIQNDDTEVTRGWIKKMTAALEKDPAFGLANPTWKGRPARVSVDDYGKLLDEKYKGRLIETDWARGFCIVVKRTVVDRIGGLDDDFSPAYFDDVDYSIRAIEAGFKCIKALDTYVYHHMNKTFFQILKPKRWNELHEEKKHLCYRKWGRPLKFVVVMDSKDAYDKKELDDIIGAIFYLARKQNRVYVWSPSDLKGELAHTNIILKTMPRTISSLILPFSLYFNAKKRLQKRYNGVFFFDKKTGKSLKQKPFLKDANIFVDDKADFNGFVKMTADRIKEETRGI